MLLQVAQYISSTNARFRKGVRLIAFSGEEQGLYGSKAYAKHAKAQNMSIAGMIQGDMLGFNKHVGGVGVAFIRDYVSTSMTAVVRGIVSEYMPLLEQSQSTACCSDHQSFHELGYPSVGFVEPEGYRVDPEYHHVGDLVNRPGYNVEQILAITKAILACIAVLAGIQ
jgi:Zn-dependent M28 family amino/carboxypeptidase